MLFSTFKYLIVRNISFKQPDSRAALTNCPNTSFNEICWRLDTEIFIVPVSFPQFQICTSQGFLLRSYILFFSFDTSLFQLFAVVSTLCSSLDRSSSLSVIRATTKNWMIPLADFFCDLNRYQCILSWPNLSAAVNLDVLNSIRVWYG